VRYDWAAQQLTLPRLPLPELKDTVARYLDQLEPLVDATAFQEAKVAAEEFLRPGGQGEALQAELEARNNANPKVCNCCVQRVFCLYSKDQALTCRFHICPLSF
jgi:hypothetical protein